ncbi:hypothetical protein [Piscinibacter sp.]|nr:hypothetical protein [Albitalea sp.]HUG26032.1 hypothetical protein [Albitalea sp.]
MGLAIIDGALDPETSRALMAEGTRLDAETARLLAPGDEAGRTM